MTNGGSPADSIGMATMASDGTITLTLRADDGGGLVGDGCLVYPKTHAAYANILEHLQGLEPGQEKPVPPWPASDLVA